MLTWHILLLLLTPYSLQQSSMVVDAIHKHSNYEYIVRRIRYDWDFPANSDSVGVASMYYTDIIKCDTKDGFMFYPDEDCNWAVDCYKIAWPFGGGPHYSIFLFETNRGLYMSGASSTIMADLILPNPPELGQRWSIQNIPAWIDGIGTATINGSDRTLIRVGIEYGRILPNIYIWALDYGLIYHAKTIVDTDGVYCYEYIEKVNYDIIMSHPLIKWFRRRPH